MTVKDTLYYCLIKYSTIYENKWQVYSHLFSTYGNGYEWVNGELIPCEFIKYSKTKKDKDGNPSLVKMTLSKVGIKKSEISDRVKKEAEDFSEIFYVWSPARLESDRRKFYEEHGGIVYECLKARADSMNLPFPDKETYLEDKIKEEPVKRSLMRNDETEEDILKRGQSVNHSYVYNYPDDIKKDWAEARQEWENYLRSKNCWLKED